ncbi:hypothetical protein Sango_1510000 [Sesamum angolense]|uniref:Uncharacterized protein n=1 Tax=Sesamum angolense TaxID=2727404 RepID=A0AAE1WP48_9LAMI|nr:hypothetical protein Sango_1510000 [Sesamum angolense]
MAGWSKQAYRLQQRISPEEAVHPDMVGRIAVGLVVGFLGYTYVALRPPSPKICGSPGGPPVTSPRVRLGDGRHLAYKERGLPKEEAKHKIIVVHAFGDSKGLKLPISEVRHFARQYLLQDFPVLSEILVAKMRLENKELLKELQIYLVAFDRAGYGESDPNPKRSVRSDALDVQELADKLQLGPKFMLSGAALVVPLTNYWWRCFPAKLSEKGLSGLVPQDRKDRCFQLLNLEILKHLAGPQNEEQAKVEQQGTHESLYRDLMVGFGKWEFEA